MITFLKRGSKDRNLKKLKSYEKGCWINVVNPSDEEIDTLAENFKLDKPNLISGLDKNEVSRVEVEKSTLYILLKIVTPTKTDLDTVLIVVTKNYLLTLTRINAKFISELTKKKIKFVTTNISSSLITILSLINKEFERSTLDIVKYVKGERDDIQEFTDREIKNLLLKEDLLNKFVLAYHQTNLVLQRIMRLLKVDEDEKEMIEDLVIESQQGYELCKLSLRTISNVRRYSDIMFSHKLNKLINILTIFTVLISIPSAISGLYGMNIALPFQTKKPAQKSKINLS